MELGFRKWKHQLPFDREDEGPDRLLAPLFQMPRFGKKNFCRGKDESEKVENLKFL